MKKSKDNGYVYAPYIIVNEPGIIVDGNINMIRLFRIKQRKQKIEKILNKIRNGYNN